MAIILDTKHKTTSACLGGIITSIVRSPAAQSLSITNLSGTWLVNGGVDVKYANAEKMKDRMIYDKFNILHFGDYPEEDLEKCYNILKGIESYSIPITHLSYDVKQLDAYKYAGMIMGVKYHEDVLSVYSNNPSYDDLDNIMKFIKKNEEIPCYLMTTGGEKLRIRGYPVWISYNIRISDELVEQWEIQITFRSITQ